MYTYTSYQHIHVVKAEELCWRQQAQLEHSSSSYFSLHKLRTINHWFHTENVDARLWNPRTKRSSVGGPAILNKGDECEYGWRICNGLCHKTQEFQMTLTLLPRVTNRICLARAAMMSLIPVGIETSFHPTPPCASANSLSLYPQE